MTETDKNNENDERRVQNQTFLNITHFQRPKEKRKKERKKRKEREKERMKRGKKQCSRTF